MAASQASTVSESKPRQNSLSQASESSQTAAECVQLSLLVALIANSLRSFIKEQLSLEAEAREALPYVRHHHSRRL